MSMADEVGDGEGLVRLDQVQAVMRHVRAIRGGHLRGPDVEAPEHLARVSRDDLRRNTISLECASDSQ